ncbi:MAP/microtubule affinity-regulating kinase 4-like [Bombina bombina]|uniref:MAP/microtubule affinity-regulating kinase 4-like n=1 Tax=Bombina bombina TaxID=8345 RepID=UPI00235A9D22|nr:MAP/microtubule affinity-regulating kinase 4-like [Bombina bombina]
MNSSVERPRRCIGDYHLLKTLGKGAFGEVRLAKHDKTGREVAIKVIKKKSMDHAHLQILLQEAKIMKRLNHPNIVQLYKVINTRTTLYLVLEYASGGDLYHHLVKHGRMEENKARVLFCQLLAAVHHCHQKSVVHHDIKSLNILLDCEGNIKLSDFGLSDTFTLGKMTNKFPGTLTHLPPEYYERREYVGPEVDIWALGVVFYEMVTCSLPFYSQNLSTMRMFVLQGNYDVPAYLSNECKILLSKLLVKNPERRCSLEPILNNQWISIGPQLDSNSAETDEKPTCSNKRAMSSPSMSGELDEYYSCCSQHNDDHDSDNSFVTAKSSPPIPDAAVPSDEDHEETSMSSPPRRTSRWRSFWKCIRGLFCCCCCCTK